MQRRVAGKDNSNRKYPQQLRTTHASKAHQQPSQAKMEPGKGDTARGGSQAQRLTPQTATKQGGGDTDRGSPQVHHQTSWA